MVGFGLASAWETVADQRSDATALRHGDQQLSWAEFDSQAARLAGGLSQAGIGAGDHVALALFNDPAYLLAEYAAFKQRAVPLNVNYRYQAKELAYLLADSDTNAVFFDHTLADRFAAARSELPDVRLWVQVGPGPVPEWAMSFDDLLDSPPAPRIERSGDDFLLMYTGGTTGNPKGVMWPHVSIVALVGRALEPYGMSIPTTLGELSELIDLISQLGLNPRQLAASPLMHGASGMAALTVLTFGGSVTTLTNRSFDPAEAWKAAVDSQSTMITIVGDVFAKPMVDELDRAAKAGSAYDLSGLQEVLSTGVMWSQPVKERLLAHGQASGAALRCTDSLGASEGVGFGLKTLTGDSAVDGAADTAVFELGPNAALFTEGGIRIEPTSDEVGLLAVAGAIPLGYYKDPEKTAGTFREYEGKRWSVPGDYARHNNDGTITLLGRGSVSINTGGEKVFPEEVEEVLKTHPSVADAYIVGVPDPTWGSAVTAVVQPSPGATIDRSELIAAAQTSLASYKLPKNVVIVDQLLRSPNGKADYRWASATARAALGLDD